jgi:transcriptional regulator with XRE-family HTH domain
MTQKGSREKMISVAQIRGARGLLGWSQTKLANEAGLSLPTIKRLEAQGTIKVSGDAREAARHALEAAGVEFIDENGGGAGVRLKKRLEPKKPSGRRG